MRILINTLGSYGDLYPYLALGRELRGRGHDVVIATSAAYQSNVASAGLAFHPVPPDVSLTDREMLAYVMDVKHGSERVVRYVASVVRESYADLLDPAANADLILTHPITFAGVLAAQKLRKPWVSTVLAPTSFFSAYDPPVIAPAPWMRRLRFLGPHFARAWMGSAKRQTLPWMQPVLELRAELGLAPAAHPLFEGQHAPSLVLALFSQLLAAPQPDWPRRTVVTGFCFFDPGETPPGLEEFLNNGPAPIVFTLGSSAVGAAGDFYPRSMQAVRRLGARAVFLTGAHPQGLPAALPDHIMSVAYAPHARVFPRAAVIVHQGGIGTTGQALRAGRPMLIVPFAHDQFDNAERVRSLGAAQVLPPPRYTANRAETQLQRLLSRASYHHAAALIAARIRSENGVSAAADAIEQSHRAGDLVARVF